MTMDELTAAVRKKHAAVSKEQIAKHLGLHGLHEGARRLIVGQDSENWQVLAWWLVVVKPSFDPYFAIGAVHEEMWKRGPEADQHRVRGFVIEGELAAVAPLQADPIPEYLAQLNPFRVERTHRQKIRSIAPGDGDATEEFDWCEMRTLDGLGYTFQWGSKTISEGSFCFSNPRTGWTVEFERALFRFARNVDSKVGNGALNYQFERWLDYREELRHSSPGASRNERSAG